MYGDRTLIFTVGAYRIFCDLAFFATDRQRFWTTGFQYHADAVQRRFAGRRYQIDTISQQIDRKDSSLIQPLFLLEQAGRFI